MQNGFNERITCPLCHISLEDSTAALSHECSASSDPSLHTVEGALEQYRNNRMAEGRDEAKRAVFGKLCHANYLFHFTTLVVPYGGRHARGTLHLDIRTMDEFIKSLDASKDVLKASNSLAAFLPSASHCPALASSLLVR